MTKIFTIISLLLITASAFTQPSKKINGNQKPPTEAELAKILENEMKGMSEEDKTEMRKMVKGMMPEMATKPGMGVSTLTDNKNLVPRKDPLRIISLSKEILTDEDLIVNTTLLYGKLMAKMPVTDKSMITDVVAKAGNGAELMEAAVIALVQGHNYAAIGLALKSVQADPKNVVHQNNLAAILSQSGYPEKAIPYLRKLSARFPSNSTVLHNLGFAWLQLGEVDTARKFFGYAAARNPNNPETAICEGVIEELRGDPKKAADHYVKAFEQAPNPFTEKMIRNIKADGRLEAIDFNKLKSRISSYPYFKKDWIKIPALADNVDGFEENSKIKNGYAKMFTGLDATIESTMEASMAEINALADKGFTEFATTMMKESQKGISMISMPAVHIQKIMLGYIVKWQEEYVTEYQTLLEGIRNRKLVMTKYDNNDKCADYDRKNNEFLRYANPLIRKFHTTKTEEARVWLNIFCTWSWYVAGNPRNTVLTQCVAWTSFLAEIYKSSVQDQYTIARSCVPQNSDRIADIAPPAVPNFTCPAIVSIPFGLDELRLSADAVNFDNNRWGIKRADDAGDHNLTLTHGIDKNYITEPGKYGNPYTKTGSGSITPPGLGINDLTPLSKVRDESTPLNPALLDSDRKSSLKNIRNAAMTKQLLNALFKTECPGKEVVKKTRKERFDITLGKLEVFEWNEELNAYVNDEGKALYDKDSKRLGEMEVSLGELEITEWNEDLAAWVNDKGELMYDKDGKPFGKFEIGLGELEFEDIKTSGLQTVINNGLGVAGTITNFIKGLFD